MGRLRLFSGEADVATYMSGLVDRLEPFKKRRSGPISFDPSTKDPEENLRSLELAFSFPMVLE